MYSGQFDNIVTTFDPSSYVHNQCRYPVMLHVLYCIIHLSLVYLNGIYPMAHNMTEDEVFVSV